MNVFRIRDRLVADYEAYIRGFINIKDPRISDLVEREFREGLLWPVPLLQLNPSFERGESIDELVARGVLHEECARIFRKKPDAKGQGTPLRLHRHQADAVKAARTGESYVLTTGTGSGKSLAYIIPIVDQVLRNGSGKGIQAIVVYPMNALANSQEGELKKFLCHGYPDGKGPVSFARYTGQEKEDRKQEIIANPPDILLTNYVMLELILTRVEEEPLVRTAKGLRFLVLDELHTYRGRQGSDVAMLVRRCREAFQAERMQCVGTSATLAGSGTFDERRTEVARVASLIFGATVRPENVIGETLSRATPERDLADPNFLQELREAVQAPRRDSPGNYASFVSDPLSIWIESTFGLTRDPASGRLERARPRTLVGSDSATGELARSMGIPEDRCREAIEAQLLAAYRFTGDTESGFPPFAFRLHQFISRGDTVYASIEAEERRSLTVRGQQFVPGDPSRILLPLVFCRECGQEYYCVRLVGDSTEAKERLEPRDLNDRTTTDTTTAGFLYLNTRKPWPADMAQVMELIPDDWIEEHRGERRVRRDRREWLPRAIRVAPAGEIGGEGIECHFLSAPFRTCLSCGVAYDARQRTDFGKLASLATEGRSTATTILALSVIRHLRKEEALSKEARKLLSFTDNRQDASLQAGHFNDFVEIGVLRSALYRAVLAAGKDGLRYDALVQKVFDALALPIELYAVNPEVRFEARKDAERALQNVLGYRVYRDLKRGWRVTLPNLEQCGLLEIAYGSLDEIAAAEDLWGSHHALQSARPETRREIARTLLDLMRRELAMKVELLDPNRQEQIKQQSFQHMIAPWAIDENERMETASVLYPRPREAKGPRYAYWLSPRGTFGQYLSKKLNGPFKVAERDGIIGAILRALKEGGILDAAGEPLPDGTTGYQLKASAILWRAGDGTRPFHDPLRVPRTPEGGGRTNPFFLDYYQRIADEGKGFEAREHTAQVKYDVRIEREERFREGRLPVLFCSPTMELGVDIATLNAVNMRNVPPTPASYAQRSGRAGRSAQPALVFSYCSTFSSHDQYFFRRPDRMVAGAVTPPRLDLANEDLIRSHIQATWLAQTRLSLGKSLKDVLDLEGEEPTLKLQANVRDSIRNEGARRRAEEAGRRILAGIEGELRTSGWYTDHWLREVLEQVHERFDQACERWRGLYRAALKQCEYCDRVIRDASKPTDERERAKALRREAEAQMELLTEAQRAVEADFYSYRYFAGEGFLPGYNFPRLPLSAFIPGRRQGRGRDDYLSRPRFIAISEFGPRSIVYHEGARYRINRAILPVGEEGDRLVTTAAKQCDSCGYLHPMQGSAGPDLCERCRGMLPPSLQPLFRIQNVSTRRLDKINSDEEERLRIGYEIRTGIRFTGVGGHPSLRTARIVDGQEALADLVYGPSATLWRINLGWRHRADRNQLGFVIDTDRGYWAKNQLDPEEEEGDDDPAAPRTARVIPYVEDRRNALLVAPRTELTTSQMASLQAALKTAIQVEFQLEDKELAAEPLPSPDDRRLILLYEAAEGGAGVLRRLLDDPDTVARLGQAALEICHFDPATAADRRMAPGSKEECTAACYDCLMSYTNQQDHRLLDRRQISEFLVRLSRSRVGASPGPAPRAEHLAALKRQAGSDLERDWLDLLESRNLRLPSAAQTRMDACATRPDFIYRDQLTAVYIDGPPHEYRERQERDRQQTECMENLGWTVIRFSHREEWEPILRKYPNIFGGS